jgi:endonuclease/exonuclease/phosphatase (EEP) superfamily protein YafD
MMSTAIQWFVVAVGLAMAGGTLLSLSRSPHWFVRGWDFPRLLVACLAFLAGAVYAFWFFDGRLWEQLFLLAMTATVVWQAYRIWPYTRTAPTQVKRARGRSGARLRLVVSNVQMQNRDYERWRRVVLEPDPDLILAVEIDEHWVEALRPLQERYPHAVLQPQDNMYGMAVYSRLPVVDPEIRFIVDDAYPSIHALVELRDGTRVFFHGVHPAPPEPIRDQDSEPRDAELVVMAREVSDHGGPAIVAGDLNDVAWSYTTRLFQGISGMLDPRRGRGLYNTWPVAVPLCRVPLDHIFFSNCFRLVELRVLHDVGSDHFPVLIELQHEPGAAAVQPEAEPEPQQEVEAQEMIDRAEESTGRMVASRCRRRRWLPRWL